jgi:hypothetical protein
MDDGLAPNHCRQCGSDLVEPADWSKLDDDSWLVELRCPDCEHRPAWICDADGVAAWDDVLEEGTRAMVLSLQTMQRERMRDDVELLIDAVHGDRLLPEDF